MFFLAEIVRNVLVIIIVASFLEILLPEGRIKPFVRFSIGLFILIAVLTPSLAWLFNDKSFQVDLWHHPVRKGTDVEKIEATGQEINRQIMDSQQALIREKMQGQISAVVMLVPGVEEAYTEAVIDENGTLSRVNIVVKGEKHQLTHDRDVGVFSSEADLMNRSLKEQIDKKIRQVVKNLYGLSEEKIDIKFAGG
ncbi:MAG: stage III sporulation protein AF [Syntrophomonadaceae bacterium]|jgi:stage III sporulation protein AF